MFTGIVEEKGTVRSVIRAGQSIRLRIQCSKVLDGTRLGDSIAVNGICLTVDALHADAFSSDVMPETMRTTTLAGIRSQEAVHLERALSLQDRLGGHFVSGHIDGVGHLIRTEVDDSALVLTLEASPDMLRFMILRGSVALDGVSLTLIGVEATSFRVSLIPHTLRQTVFADRQTGDSFNIECDLIGKYVARFTDREPSARTSSNLTMETLIGQGF